MLKLKIKSFQKWAKKTRIQDDSLVQAIQNLEENKSSVDLGGGLFKVRVARAGQGKSGGHRTFLAYKEDDRAIFIYGFSKNERENLDRDELEGFKRYATELLDLDQSIIDQGLENGAFYRICEDES